MKASPAPESGLVMDPYRTLGIHKGCTRQEAKDAFRARAWHLHPDCGGDEQAFIQLDTAYKMILQEIDFVQSNPTVNPARGPDTSPPSHPFDSRWEPEIIVLGSSPPVSRPARAPDPGWDPEMILLDEPPRSPMPFDPSWNPELVLLDEPRPAVRETDLKRATAPHHDWLRKLANPTNRGNSVLDSTRTRGILTTILLILIVVGLLIVLVAAADRGIRVLAG